jgi:phospholipid transport system transporter-binding protein
MNSKAGIQSGSDGSVQISGEMTFSTTPQLYREFEGHLRGEEPELSIDLGQVDRADSSGLALLLEWQAMAGQHKRTLHITNAPHTLMSLAKLCEADSLLDISERGLELDANS